MIYVHLGRVINWLYFEVKRCKVKVRTSPDIVTDASLCS